MDAKELIDKPDSPSALMYWLHMYYNNHGYSAEETMLYMSMALGIKNVMLSDQKIDGRTVIHVQYVDKPHSFLVYQDQLRAYVFDKHDTIEVDSTVDRDAPDKWMQHIVAYNGSVS